MYMYNSMDYKAVAGRRTSVVLALILTGVAACFSPTDPRAVHEQVMVTSVDPLVKVLRETSVFPSHEAVTDAARGEHASFQFAVRADMPIFDLQVEANALETSAGDALPAPKTGFVGYVRVSRSTPTPSRDRLRPPSGYYPDPILEVASIDIKANQSQPVWVTVRVPVEAGPGMYSGTLVIKGSLGNRQFSREEPYAVRVHNAQVDTTSLWVTNWFSLSPQRLGQMNDRVPVEPYTERYWELVRVIAAQMAEYHQNVALISPLRLAQYARAGDELEIDFSRFDQMVRIFEEEGVIGRIEGGHIGHRESTWSTPFVVHVPALDDEENDFVRVPITDDRARTFYSTFLPALVKHLRRQGWLDSYLQHLADEPIEANAASYAEIADFVHRWAPELAVIEAVHNRDLVGSIDVWVPQLDYLDQDFDFYTERMQEGQEVWFYTCLAPQGEYANRFVELPLIKTRILHWINYKYRIPGYLHWGYNFWRDAPFDETTGIITESGNVLPGGDAWIVYPGPGKLQSSIRLEAMRDGIVDYELLMKLEKLYPEEAAEMSRRVVYQFDRYDTSVEAFRQKRKRMLEMLSTDTGV